MTQTTKSKTWPTKKPTLVYMVPAEGIERYGLLMAALTNDAKRDLELGDDDIEVIGLVSSSPAVGAEGLYSLEELDVNTRAIRVIVLWGETAMSAGMQHSVPEEAGIGTIILDTGVVVPMLRLPSIEGDWWADPLNQSYALARLEALISRGRDELDGTEPFSFITNHAVTWN